MKNQLITLGEETVKITLHRYEEMKKRIVSLEKDLSEFKDCKTMIVSYGYLNMTEFFPSTKAMEKLKKVFQAKFLQLENNLKQMNYWEFRAWKKNQLEEEKTKIMNEALKKANETLNNK